MATYVTVGSMMDGGGGGTGIRGFTDGTVMVGWLGADKTNGPDDKYADSVCLRPHADFLLASLTAFSSILSFSMKLQSLSMFLYLE